MSQFTDKYLEAQRLATQLNVELINIRRMGLTAIDSITEFHGEDMIGGNRDPEQGSTNPIFLALDKITTLRAQIRQNIYHCEQLAATTLDTRKLVSLEAKCSEADDVLSDYRAKLDRKKKELHNKEYLFGDKKGVIFDNLYKDEHDSGDDDDDDYDESSGLTGKKKLSERKRNKYLTNENELIQQSLGLVNDALSNAMNTIDSFQRQHEIFRNIQRKTADIAQQLGFSQNVIVWIRRQENINMLIAFVGMFLTVFIVGVFYYWWNKK